MNENEKALAFLRTLGDPALYEQMAQTLVRGMGRVVRLTQDALLLYSRRGDLYMIAAKTREAALSVSGEIPAFAKNVLLHGFDRALALEIRPRFQLAHVLEFVLYAYYGEYPEEPEIEVRALTMEDVDFLLENYGHAQRDYLAERVRDGVMLGAIVDHEIAAFIGEHVEGAMGLLHVMPKYRRLGLGFAMERALMRRTMEKGYVPFNQVFPDNAASHRLQKRLGFTRAQGTLCWITDDEY